MSQISAFIKKITLIDYLFAISLFLTIFDFFWFFRSIYLNDSVHVIFYIGLFVLPIVTILLFITRLRKQKQKYKPVDSTL